MIRPRTAVACASAAVLLMATTGCGQEIAIAEPGLERGAVLFNQRCSGCHTLDDAAALGSKPARDPTGGERTNGPNFNVRRESREDVLYAIRNGGFSGAIMPANIVVGQDAELVADFVAEYAGRVGAGQ